MDAPLDAAARVQEAVRVAHGVSLPADDPLCLLGTLEAHFVADLAAALEAARDVDRTERRAALAELLEKAELSAIRVVGVAAENAGQQVREIITDFAYKTAGRMDDVISATELAALATVRLARYARWFAVGCLGMFLFMVWRTIG